MKLRREARRWALLEEVAERRRSVVSGACATATSIAPLSAPSAALEEAEAELAGTPSWLLLVTAAAAFG